MVYKKKILRHCRKYIDNFFYNTHIRHVKGRGYNFHKDKILKNNKYGYIYYIILLLIALFISGDTLSNIRIHMAVNQVIADGIDYDAFREMKIGKKQIIKAQENSKDPEETSLHISSIPKRNGMDDITLTMMIHEFDITHHLAISKYNMDQYYQLLCNNGNYQELKRYYTAIFADIVYFPLGNCANEENKYSFSDSWNAYRGYGGNRRHEGTDIFPEKNIRGVYPVVSMTDGVVEKMGWLDQGGNRIGIRGKSGAYFYYAHLDSYANLKIGDPVCAGQFLGYMGDSGYGKEGTKGMFDVHLHVGIYVDSPFGELSVNPYWIMAYLENR